MPYLLLLFSLFNYAYAGTSLVISHPRNPSHQTDKYSIKCEKDCSLEIMDSKPTKGHSKLTAFESAISEIIDLHTKGQLPQTRKIVQHQVLYKIEANQNGKEVELLLGYPKSYLGAEFQKYSALIIKIEEIKKTMRDEIIRKEE